MQTELTDPDEFDWMATTSDVPNYQPPDKYLLFQAPQGEKPFERKLRMLTQVKRACMACSMCELGRSGATKDNNLFRDPHVFSNMNPTRFIIYGQNPGWTELEKCEPFVGQAGENFDSEIEKHGISRNDFYIANSVRCFTNSNVKPLDKHIRSCEPFLRIEINLIKPILVVALGAVAFDRLCQGVSFSDNLGKIVNSSVYEIPVFPIYHPSPLNLQDKFRRQMFNEQIELLCKIIKRIKIKIEN